MFSLPYEVSFRIAPRDPVPGVILVLETEERVRGRGDTLGSRYRLYSVVWLMSEVDLTAVLTSFPHNQSSVAW